MPLNPIYREVDGVIIPGTYLQAFIKNGDHYFVTEINIYKDGWINCWDWVDLEGFKAKVRSGWVRTTLPEGSRISMMVSTLNFTVTHVKGGAEEEEFIKEVEDALRSLNKEPTSATLCREAFERYQQNPTLKTKEELRVCYEAVPKHRRRFLGDMDSKDLEYRRALGVP